MTQEVKHTPTPWLYDERHNGIYEATPDARGAIVRIADIVRVPNYQANAAHIVACVNGWDTLQALNQALVAALRDLVADHEELEARVGKWENGHEFLSGLNAVDTARKLLASEV